MLTWITFFVGVVISYALGYLFSLEVFTFGEYSIIFIVALVVIIAINALTAIVCTKFLPDKCFDISKKFYKTGEKEYSFYNKIKIKLWKDRIAEWGKLNGFSKKNIENPKDPEYIKKFIFECNKGYLTHLISIFTTALILMVVPKSLILPMALPMFITSFLLNYGPLMILRYNSYRLQKLLKFTERKK